MKYETMEAAVKALCASKNNKLKITRDSELYAIHIFRSDETGAGDKCLVIGKPETIFVEFEHRYDWMYAILREIGYTVYPSQADTNITERHSVFMAYYEFLAHSSTSPYFRRNVVRNDDDLPVWYNTPEEIFAPAFLAACNHYLA